MPMKPTITLPISIKRKLLILWLGFCPLLAYAQQELNTEIRPDSTDLSRLLTHPSGLTTPSLSTGNSFAPASVASSAPIRSPYQLTPAFQYYLDQGFGGYQPIYLQTNPNPVEFGDYSTGGVIRQFRRSALLGAGTQSTVYGEGKINTADLSYQHYITPRLSFTAGANVTKVGFLNYTSILPGASAMVSYRFNDQFSVHGFGNYARDLQLNMNQISYGGYVDWSFSERFGTEVGVNNYYDPFRQRWEMNPIVVPYIKVGEAKFGFDIGPAIKEAIINATQSKNQKVRMQVGPREMGPMNTIPIRRP